MAKRRTALACVLLGVAGLAGAQSPIVRTGDPSKRGYTDAEFPRIQKVAPNVFTYEQLRSAGEEKFTTVSLIVVTSGGVLVADGQGSVDETRRMIGEIAKVTAQPVTHVVIGSDHGDHTAGNAAFPSDATFYVHPASKAALEGGRTPLPESATLVRDREVIRIGGTEVQILFLGRAHTGGDLSVYLPRERILFMSEAFLNRIFPAMRSAFPSEWVAAIERAQKLPVDIFVPGHGFVDPPDVLREELETYRRAVQQVIAEGRRLHGAGVAVDQAAKQATFGDLESWTLRGSQGPVAIRRVYLEIEGKLPAAAKEP